MGAELNAVLWYHRPRGNSGSVGVDLVNTEASIIGCPVGCDLPDPCISDLTRREVELGERNVVDVDHLRHDVARCAGAKVRLPVPVLCVIVGDYQQLDLATGAGGAIVRSFQTAGTRETQCLYVRECLGPISERPGWSTGRGCRWRVLVAPTSESSQQDRLRDALDKQNPLSRLLRS